MLVKHAKSLARKWVIEKGSKIDNFYGAFFHGSINSLPDYTTFPEYSDVDVMIVLNSPNPPTKIGKFLFHDILIEVSYISKDLILSPNSILGNYHLAGSFQVPSIILDPSGHLTKNQTTVSKNFSKRKWVVKRCEHAENKILKSQLKKTDPLPDQVNAWLFPVGITTHMLLIAGLKNPTVRKRYVEAKKILAAYNYLELYEILLEILGCAEISQIQVQNHLKVLTTAFDTAKETIKTPFFFASDISDIARPIAIGGSQQLIDSGYHREAIFWIVATYARCQKIFYCDGSVKTQNWYSYGFRNLLADLGINSFSDLQERSKQNKKLLSKVWKTVEAIIEANPKIKN